MKDKLVLGFYLRPKGDIRAVGDLGGFSLPQVMTLIESMTGSMKSILEATRKQTTKPPEDAVELTRAEMQKIIADGKDILEGRKY